MSTPPARPRSTADTRAHLLDVARETLGQNPDAGMGEIASAAGVVRRTVYGYFPARADLLRTLTQQAVEEMTAVLDDVDTDADDAALATVWAEFVGRVWPLADRYRVLVALRRGEHGEQIHELLQPVEDRLTDLVHRGQAAGAFGSHLPPRVMGQIAFAAVFAIVDSSRSGEQVDAQAAIDTSLLVLGVPGRGTRGPDSERRDAGGTRS